MASESMERKLCDDLDGFKDSKKEMECSLNLFLQLLMFSVQKVSILKMRQVLAQMKVETSLRELDQMASLLAYLEAARKLMRNTKERKEQ